METNKEDIIQSSNRLSTPPGAPGQFQAEKLHFRAFGFESDFSRPPSGACFLVFSPPPPPPFNSIFAQPSLYSQSVWIISAQNWRVLTAGNVCENHGGFTFS